MCRAGRDVSLGVYLQYCPPSERAKLYARVYLYPAPFISPQPPAPTMEAPGFFCVAPFVSEPNPSQR